MTQIYHSMKSFFALYLLSFICLVVVCFGATHKTTTSRSGNDGRMPPSRPTCPRYKPFEPSCSPPDILKEWPLNSDDLPFRLDQRERTQCLRPSRREDTLVLFDVDGTLTKSRGRITSQMTEFLKQLREVVTIGFVGGSNLQKQKEQLGEDVMALFDFQFPENGLVAFRNNNLVFNVSLAEYLGEVNLRRVVSQSMKFLSFVSTVRQSRWKDYLESPKFPSLPEKYSHDFLNYDDVDDDDDDPLILPFQRGTFIELRTGLLNLCPVGRSVSQEERMKFVDIDEKFSIRKTFISYLESVLNSGGNKLDLRFVIGGQISIDVFPKGWDKTFTLEYFSLPENDVNKDNYDIEESVFFSFDSLKIPKLGSFSSVHFFGDRTAPGGNDYFLYIHPRVKGHSVLDPEDTVSQTGRLFLCWDLFDSMLPMKDQISSAISQIATARDKKDTKGGKFVLGFTGSSFDLMHPGHMIMLKDAKQHCDYLVAGLQIDPTIDRPDKNSPVQTFKERQIILSSVRYVDLIIPYITELDILRIMTEIQPDVRILGSDWQGKYFTGYELPIEIHWHSRNHSWSSTELRHRIWDREEAKLKLNR